MCGNKWTNRAGILIVLFTAAALMFSGCSRENSTEELVVYTSVDQVFSEPVLKEFEKNTGIKVLPVYDVEAAKTTGLVNRLIAEKNRPIADVFWSGEFTQTIKLKENGVLEAYKSPSASDIPQQYKNIEGLWTGFGGRARVLIVNKKLLNPGDYPKSLFDLINTKVPGNKIGIAYPLFGTTLTHAAALYAALGQETGKDFFVKLKEKGVCVVDGNSVVRDMVSDGRLVMGLTDTDDAYSALAAGKDIEVIFLDQNQDGIGTLVTPNTVALIKGAPHSREAKKFIDYILKKEMEEKLLKMGWIDLTVRPSASKGKTGSVKPMKQGLEDIYKQLPVINKELKEIFVR